MYEIDKAMFEKMNMIETDKFPLVNQLKPNRVHLKLFNTHMRISLLISYSMLNKEQSDPFVINEIVWNRVLSPNINYQ